MMATGVFEATAVGDRGHVGVYVNSMYSTDPKSTWKHVAQAHVAMERDPALTQTLYNMWLALPYGPAPPVIVDITKLQENVLPLPDGVDAPADAVYLVAAVDNQEGRRDDPANPPRGEITILAACRNNRWHVVDHRIISRLDYVTGYGEEKRIAIDPFSVEYVDAVYEALDREYVTADGRRLKVRKTFIDCGWQTEQAYRFCMMPSSRERSIVPIRGDGTERASRKVSLLPKSGALRRSKRSGRSYLWIGTWDAKDEVARRLAVPAPAPGSITYAAHLPERYFQGLLAQCLVEPKPGIRVWAYVRMRDQFGSPEEDVLEVQVEWEIHGSHYCPLDWTRTDSQKWTTGIATVRSKPVRYKFWAEDPLEATAGQRLLDLDRSEIYHVADPKLGLLRGRPMLAPALLRAIKMTTLEDSELPRKQVASLMSVFAVRPVDSSDDESMLPTEDEVDDMLNAVALSPGGVFQLPYGFDLKTFEPKDELANFERALRWQLMMICMSVGLPINEVTNDDGVERWGRLTAQRVQRQANLMHDLYEHQMLNRMRADFIDAAMAAGSRRNGSAVACGRSPGAFGRITRRTIGRPDPGRSPCPGS